MERRWDNVLYLALQKKKEVKDCGGITDVEAQFVAGDPSSGRSCVTLTGHEKELWKLRLRL